MLKKFSDFLKEHPELLDEIYEAVGQLRKEMEQRKKWVPVYDEIFFFADTINRACTQAVYHPSTRNAWLSQTGNCFPDMQSARKHLEKLLKAEEFRSLGRGFVQGAENWYAVYNPSSEDMVFLRTSSVSEGTYFPSRKACEDAVQAIGGKEVFIKYVLGIND